MSMQWLWKSRTPKSDRRTPSPDWEGLYQLELEAHRTTQNRGDTLELDHNQLKVWVARVCVLVPQLKVRSDRDPLKLKAQLDTLVAEAAEKGWIDKKGKPSEPV